MFERLDYKCLIIQIQYNKKVHVFELEHLILVSVVNPLMIFVETSNFASHGFSISNWDK